MENSFFDQDYINKIVIYQSMYLNYCKHKKVYNCHQYNPFDKNNEFLDCEIMIPPEKYDL